MYTHIVLFLYAHTCYAHTSDYIACSHPSPRLSVVSYHLSYIRFSLIFPLRLSEIEDLVSLGFEDNIDIPFFKLGNFFSSSNLGSDR